MFFYKQMINYAVLVILLHKYHLKLGLSSFPAAVACCKRQRDVFVLLLTPLFVSAGDG